MNSCVYEDYPPAVDCALSACYSCTRYLIFSRVRERAVAARWRAEKPAGKGSDRGNENIHLVCLGSVKSLSKHFGIPPRINRCHPERTPAVVATCVRILKTHGKTTSELKFPLTSGPGCDKSRLRTPPVLFVRIWEPAWD